MMEFDNLNGFLVEKGEKIFDTSLRLMKYGDGVFETMKVVDGKILFWEDHYIRLKKAIDKLKLDDSSKQEPFWKKELDRVIVKNYYKHAKIRLIVFRNSPGLYTPMNNRIGFLIEGMRFDKPNYLHHDKAFKLGLYEEERKPINGFAGLKTTNALLFVLASVYKKEQELDDVIILNSKGKVCESTSSNVFGVKGGVVFTPSLKSGCLEGVFRKQVIEFLKEKNIQIEERDVTLDELKNCDEIFLTNTISGAQGVTDFLGKSLASDLVLSVQKKFQKLPNKLGL